jgi:hypothetical protein
MKYSWLQLDPGAGNPGGGGEGNTFLATLPENLRGEPSLATFKDPGTLAKSYVEAQKLIGAKRLAIPGEKATDAEWESVYNQLGRPETADKYEDVVLKDEKGNVLMAPEKTQVDELKKFFHKMGLTGKQACMMQEYSLNYLHKNQSGAAAESQAAADTQLKSLKEEWGDKFPMNVDTARAVIKKFGGDQAGEVTKFLDDSGLGNNAQLVKLFAKIGESMLEDRGNRGNGNSLPINDQTKAVNEIKLLTTDPEFQKILGNASAPGHAEAAERWRNLFVAAYPGKSE